MINEAQYLGDGLYVQFDGYQVWLLANSHTHPTDKVALEPPVLEAFLSFVRELKELIAAQQVVGEPHE